MTCLEYHILYCVVNNVWIECLVLTRCESFLTQILRTYLPFSNKVIKVNRTSDYMKNDSGYFSGLYLFYWVPGYLNRSFSCHYKHRFSTTELNGLVLARCSFVYFKQRWNSKNGGRVFRTFPEGYKIDLS